MNYLDFSFGWPVGVWLGAVAELGRLVKELALQRLLLVTDQRLAAAGLLVPIEAALGEAGIDVRVFDGGQPEPSLDLVDDCLVLGREFQPQGRVGAGRRANGPGQIWPCCRHGGSFRYYVGDCRVPAPVAPIICVPTTAGTGSEVYGAAVLTDRKQDQGRRAKQLHEARLALVDPR